MNPTEKIFSAHPVGGGVLAPAGEVVSLLDPGSRAVAMQAAFKQMDSTFSERAVAHRVLVGREELGPVQFPRTCRIVPLTFRNTDDYAGVNQGDKVTIDVSNLEGELYLDANGEKLPLDPNFELKDIAVLKAGGALPHFKATYRA